MKNKIVIDPQRVSWFESHARKIVSQCARVTTLPPSGTQGPPTVYLPGADNKYPSFWVRDAVMQCRSGLIPIEHALGMLQIILTHQNGPVPRNLAHGLRIDPWAVADHINLPGLVDTAFEQKNGLGAVFFPGSYRTGEDQGMGRHGLRPPDDDIYEVVSLVGWLLTQLDGSEGLDLLRQKIDGISVIERLDRGMTTGCIDKETGLCRNDESDWSASSFHDALRPMGLVALTSCMRARAARTLAACHQQLASVDQAQKYRTMFNQIKSELVAQLQRDDGWLNCATRINRQPDLWATSMAVYEDLLAPDARQAACLAMLAAWQNGTIANQGYLRHTPVTADVDAPQRVWEHSLAGDLTEPPYGYYQNGGYWPQPVGWFVHSLNQVDQDAATQVLHEFIDHTREHEDQGAPFEFIDHHSNVPVDGRRYGPSAAVPLEAIRRMTAPSSVAS